MTTPTVLSISIAKDRLLLWDGDIRILNMAFLKKSEKYLIYGAWLILGIIIGGYLFSGVQPRSFLTLHDCESKCLTSKEFLGLLGSVGMQKFGGAIPLVIKETDKTVAIVHPRPQARVHYVVIPKIDIKDIGDIKEGSEPYVVDAFGVIAELVRENDLSKYRIITNGPGYQSVAYLHFHLLAN